MVVALLWLSSVWQSSYPPEQAFQRFDFWFSDCVKMAGYRLPSKQSVDDCYERRPLAKKDGLEFRLFCHFHGIIYYKSKIPFSTFKLRCLQLSKCGEGFGHISFMWRVCSNQPLRCPQLPQIKPFVHFCFIKAWKQRFSTGKCCCDYQNPVTYARIIALQVISSKFGFGKSCGKFIAKFFYIRFNPYYSPPIAVKCPF